MGKNQNNNFKKKIYYSCLALLSFLYISCGVESISEDTSSLDDNVESIVHGRDADIVDIPWQIGLMSKNSDGVYSHMCGGSILSRRWVITADHCLQPNLVDTTGKRDKYVVAGITRITNNQKSYPGSQLIKVKNIYKQRYGDVDIALLQLERPLVFNKNIQPILFTDNKNINTKLVKTGQEVLVSGWGNTNDVYSILSIINPIPLQRAFLEIVDQKQSSSEYIVVVADVDHKKTYISWGDSGGPGVVYFNSIPYLIGISVRITSYEGYYATAYLNPYYFRNWINQHVIYDWGNNDRMGIIHSVYEYNNPYNGETEYFSLQGLGSDNRYWYFPTDKGNNTYWLYLGTDQTAALKINSQIAATYKKWDNENQTGNPGDLYLYTNPYTKDAEVFKLKTTSYSYFPIDKKNNQYWEYIEDLDDTTFSQN